jgi:hypothetical protein
MISSASAPIARADDFTEILADVQAEQAAANYITEANTIYTTGMTDMTSQANDFAAGDYTGGALFQDLGWLDVGTYLARLSSSVRSSSSWPQ